MSTCQHHSIEPTELSLEISTERRKDEDGECRESVSWPTPFTHAQFFPQQALSILDTELMGASGTHL